MEQFKKMLCQMREELDGAMKYTWEAIKLKSNHPHIANEYYDMGAAEVGHAEKLCRMAHGCLEKASAENNPHTEHMRILLEFEGEQKDKAISGIKRLQEMYRG